MNIPTPDFGAHTYVKRGTLITALCLSTLFLASCGGGSDTQTSSANSIDERKEALAVPDTWTGRAPGYEVINGITVPPEPAPSVNNATLAGVDINNNGVRDDVERVIARSYASPPARLSEATSYAKIEQAILVSPTLENKASYTKAVDCSALSAKELNVLTYALLNTQERRNAYAKVNTGAVGGECKGKPF